MLPLIAAALAMVLVSGSVLAAQATYAVPQEPAALTDKEDSCAGTGGGPFAGSAITPPERFW